MRDFTLDDYRQLIVKALASPDFGKQRLDLKALERHFRRIGAAIDSMTPEERADPVRLIDASRRRRIAAGAGVGRDEIRKLVRRFPGFTNVVKRMRGLGRQESD